MFSIYYLFLFRRPSPIVGLLFFTVKKINRCYLAVPNKSSIYKNWIPKSVKFCGNNISMIIFSNRRLNWTKFFYILFTTKRPTPDRKIWKKMFQQDAKSANQPRMPSVHKHNINFPSSLNANKCFFDQKTFSRNLSLKSKSFLNKNRQ